MRRGLIATVFAVQLICAVFFVSEIIITIAGLRTRPIDWHIQELIEIAAALGLIVGAIVGGILLRASLARTRRAEEQLRIAAGAFGELLEERFETWRLTRAERDVALFAIKGMSTAEIAQLRETSEGTVKAQTAAIYRKAGVNGRSQLLSLFIDDLMTGALDRTDTTRSDHAA